MEKKQTFWQKTEKFLAGKGFYIVLAACAVVIGVSAWIMLFMGSRSAIEDEAATVGQIIQPTLPTSFQQSPPAGDDDKGDPDAVKPEIPETSTVAPSHEDDAVQQLQQQEDTSEHTEDNSSNDAQETLGFVWPVSGDVVGAFSIDELVYNKTMADWRVHPGLDIASTIGTKVFAAAKGTVETVYEDDLYGTTVIIDHGNGLKSVYSNLAAAPTVNAGDSVAMGAVIGAVGDTAIGESVEAAHLHFAMTQDGVSVDPAGILPEK